MMTRITDEHGDVLELHTHDDGTFEIAILELGEPGAEPEYRDGCVLDVDAARRVHRALTVFLTGLNETEFAA